jgi:hypothetical protein
MALNKPNRLIHTEPCLRPKLKNFFCFEPKRQSQCGCTAYDSDIIWEREQTDKAEIRKEVRNILSLENTALHEDIRAFLHATARDLNNH